MTLVHKHRPPRNGRVIAVVALIVALAALGGTGWLLYRQEFESQVYSDSARAEAKAEICQAMELVRRGVSLNTNMAPAGGPDDVTGSQAVAANARVSLYDGGQYLLARLDPATPAELADEIRTFANNLMDIGAAATAGAKNADPEQAERLAEADKTNLRIAELCE